MAQRPSTKGASKQRRDSINTGIEELKQLLPVQEHVRRRLSQLQTMALCIAYFCLSNAFDFEETSNDAQLQYFDFTEALPGFLLAMTMEGRLLYISENVTQYLGHSMVDLITQSTTIYDIIELIDHGILRWFLDGSGTCKFGAMKESSQDELQFTCHVNLEKIFNKHAVFNSRKLMKVRGRLISMMGSHDLLKPVFVARFSPVLSCSANERIAIMETTMFCSRHSLDMKFTDIDKSGEFHMGYSSAEIKCHSWYAKLHSGDTEFAACQHKELIRSGFDAAKSLCVRIQTKHGHFIWLHVIMRLFTSAYDDDFPQEIICQNHVISSAEATETRERECLEEIAKSSKGNIELDRFSTSLSTSSVMRPQTVVAQDYADHSCSPVLPAANCSHQDVMEKVRQKSLKKNSKEKLKHGLEFLSNDSLKNNGMESIINRSFRDSAISSQFSQADINGSQFNKAAINMQFNHAKISRFNQLDSNRKCPYSVPHKPLTDFMLRELQHYESATQLSLDHSKYNATDSFHYRANTDLVNSCIGNNILVNRSHNVAGLHSVRTQPYPHSAANNIRWYYRRPVVEKCDPDQNNRYKTTTPLPQETPFDSSPNYHHFFQQGSLTPPIRSNGQRFIFDRIGSLCNDNYTTASYCHSSPASTPPYSPYSLYIEDTQLNIKVHTYTATDAVAAASHSIPQNSSFQQLLAEELPELHPAAVESYLDDVGKNKQLFTAEPRYYNGFGRDIQQDVFF